MCSFNELTNFFRNNQGKPFSWLSCPIPFQKNLLENGREMVAKIEERRSFEKGDKLKLCCGKSTFILQFNIYTKIEDGILTIKNYTEECPNNPLEWIYIFSQKDLGSEDMKKILKKEIGKNY